MRDLRPGRWTSRVVAKSQLIHRHLPAGVPPPPPVTRRCPHMPPRARPGPRASATLDRSSSRPRPPLVGGSRHSCRLARKLGRQMTTDGLKRCQPRECICEITTPRSFLSKHKRPRQSRLMLSTCEASTSVHAGTNLASHRVPLHTYHSSPNMSQFRAGPESDSNSQHPLAATLHTKCEVSGARRGSPGDDAPPLGSTRSGAQAAVKGRGVRPLRAGPCRAGSVFPVSGAGNGASLRNLRTFWRTRR